MTDTSDDNAHEEIKRQDSVEGKTVLTEEECWDLLAYQFPVWKKWMILCVVFVVQCSMNFNASAYGNSVSGMTQEFGISDMAAKCGQGLFLIAYAFGCELWAPWSEEYGRWWVMQLSLLAVNIWQIPCALTPNIGGMIAGRILGGLSSAGGSVTLAIAADMYMPDDQDYGVAFVVFSSVFGSVLGPVVGGFLEGSQDPEWYGYPTTVGTINGHLTWRWIFWLQLIFGFTTQMLHLFLVPETRATCIIDKEAKRRRKETGMQCFGPNEIKEQRMTFSHMCTIWARPFIMFAKEPIVLFLSLLSGFSDALVYVFIEAYSLVYGQWNFTTTQNAMAFLPLVVGYCIAYLLKLPVIRHYMAKRKKNPQSVQPESRLFWLLFMAPWLVFGLFGFAWSSLGPDRNVHWIAPMIFSALISLANFEIYGGTIDYMLAAYSAEAGASATGGNGFARDFLAGCSAFYATPMYTNIGDEWHLEYASTILACIAVLVVIPVYIFYWKGPQIRARSPYAQVLAADREQHKELREKKLPAVNSGNRPAMMSPKPEDVDV